MDNMDGTQLILLIFVVLLLLISACVTSTNRESTIPTTTTLTIPTTTTLTTLPSEKLNKYTKGDIISDSPKEQVDAIVIFDYDSQNDKYQIDTIYVNIYRQWSYRLYPNLTWGDRKNIESTYPFLINHIELSRIKTNYPSKKDMDSANLPTYTVTQTQNPVSISPSDYSGSDRSGECWVNGYYRKSGVYVHGYYRRC